MRLLHNLQRRFRDLRRIVHFISCHAKVISAWWKVGVVGRSASRSVTPVLVEAIEDVSELDTLLRSQQHYTVMQLKFSAGWTQPNAASCRSLQAVHQRAIDDHGRRIRWRGLIDRNPHRSLAARKPNFSLRGENACRLFTTTHLYCFQTLRDSIQSDWHVVPGMIHEHLKISTVHHRNSVRTTGP